MTKFQRTAVVVSLCIAAAFAVMGWIGDYDFCEQVIYNMSQEQYDSVKNILTDRDGKTPSDRDIAHWWHEHHNGD